MKCKTRKLVASAGLAMALAPVGAFAQGVRTLDAGGGLYLNQVGPRASIREPSGQVSELSLPPGTSLRRLEPLSGGWIAAGEVDAAGFSELFLLRSVDGIRTSLPVPPNEGGAALRGGPLPLVEGGRPVGLAWLAGAGVRETVVWAAQWSGRDWSQPELVSPVGPGTQIAIDGAVLADGSWLLVWSAYDGSDDEILWSRRVGDGWTEPAVLLEPNDTPDITPALVATGRGALVAWNWFDGSTYRIRLAAFEDGGWRGLQFASPAGAVRPGLTPAGDGALLLYRTAVHPSWTLHELDGHGATLRTAVVETETTTRPGLGTVDAGRAALEWPGDRLDRPLLVDVEWRAEP